MLTHTVAFVCLFTFVIHLTESVAYSIRLAGLRTQKIAIAMSFVTTSLLVSRLSNMFQAPLLGAMVDSTILKHSQASLEVLESQFRIILLFAFFGALAGACITPTAVQLFYIGIERFKKKGSIPNLIVSAFYPRNVVKMAKLIRLPRFSQLRTISLRTLPKGFLLTNVVVTSIYAIGVLCSLMAGAYLPDLRSTASQLSGIVNGIATILFTMLVDPSGARITDQAVHGERPEGDVRSVVFFMQAGKILGTLVVAQLLFKPFSIYIMWVTEAIAKFVN